MMFRRSCKDLYRVIHLEVDGKAIDVPPVEGIIILNILRSVQCALHGQSRPYNFGDPMQVMIVGPFPPQKRGSRLGYKPRKLFFQFCRRWVLAHMNEKFFVSVAGIIEDITQSYESNKRSHSIHDD